MKAGFAVLLLAMLAACTAVSPADEVERPEAPEQPRPEKTNTTTAPTERASSAAAIGDSVLLSRWNEDTGRHEIVPVTPASGEAVSDVPPLVTGSDVGMHAFAQTALTPDGSLLAAVRQGGRSCEPYAGGTSCRPAAAGLALLNLQEWVTATVTFSQTSGWVGPMAFHPEGGHLALAHHRSSSEMLLLVDAEAGRVVAEERLPVRPSLVAYALDGSALVVYGVRRPDQPGSAHPDPPRVLLLDAETLHPLWWQPLPDVLDGEWCLNCPTEHAQRLQAHWQPAVALSPGGDALYVVHADEERLTTVDLAGRSVSSVPIAPAQSWLERLLARTARVAEAKGGTAGALKQAVISPDGERLYVTGEAMEAEEDEEGLWVTERSPLDLQVVEVDGGREIARRSPAVASPWSLQLAPGGQRLLIYGWEDGLPLTAVVDAEGLETVARPGLEVVVSRRLDGRPVLLGFDYQPAAPEQTRLALLDGETFAVVESWTAGAYAAWVRP